MAFKFKYTIKMPRNQPYRAHRQTRRWRLQESTRRQELQSDSVPLSYDGSAEDDGNVIAQSAEGPFEWNDASEADEVAFNAAIVRMVSQDGDVFDFADEVGYLSYDVGDDCAPENGSATPESTHCRPLRF